MLSGVRLSDSMDCSLPGSSVHGDSPGQNTGVGSHSILQGISPTQGSNPGLPSALQVDSLPSEPPGKPKNAGVGSLSLLQVIFLTQESNWDLLHCRQILYQLPPGYRQKFLRIHFQFICQKALVMTLTGGMLKGPVWVQAFFLDAP